SISARQMLYALGPNHIIDLIDPSRWCQARASRFVRQWFHCPRFTDDPLGYLTCLGRVLRSGAYDVVLPPHDEVYLLSRVRETIGKYAAIAVPDFESVSSLSSKTRFIDLLDELDLPHPEAAVITDARELDHWSQFPVFLKLETS